MRVDAGNVESVFPTTPAGGQVAWFFRHSFSQGRELTVEEVAEHMVFPAPWEPAHGLERFREADARPFEIVKTNEPSPFELEVRLDYGDGITWSNAFVVEEAPPHRIRSIWWSKAVAEDVVIRQASPDDGVALNHLEVRAPMTLDSETVVLDRGPDFLGFTRLMEDNICFVAERDGELMGLACGALHPVRIGGDDYSVMLLHHLRVPVEHRKGGVFSSLNVRVFGAYEGRMGGAYGYTAVANAEAMRIGGPGAWSIGVYRAVLDCGALAGPRRGRVATPADAATVVEILNRGHEGEEMYLRYTVESLTARLERAPDLYTWDQVLIGDGAVVGVWPARLEVTVSTGERSKKSCRALILDHGFVPGAEAEFEALLRDWCGRLLDRGHTEVTIPLSEASPGHPIISGLAARADHFLFRMAVPEPEGTGARGVYVDPVYF